MRKPSSRKGKSIVNQKQTPWGMIAATVAVVLFAAAVVIVVIVTHKSDSHEQLVPDRDSRRAKKHRRHHVASTSRTATTSRATSSTTRRRRSAATTAGLGRLHRHRLPKAPIANENAVHMLEHGAVWITYNAKTLPASQLAELEKYVTGIDRMALSPYPNLKTPISLQSWGYQLFVQKRVNDPRIAKFIAALKYNPKTTPEYGATCSQPTFIKHPEHVRPPAVGAGTTDLGDLDG